MGKAATLLDEVGVDPIALIDMAPEIFREDPAEASHDHEGQKQAKEIDFQEFLKLVLEFRGSNTASLKDLRNMKDEMVSEFGSFKAKIMSMGRETGASKDNECVQGACPVPPYGMPPSLQLQNSSSDPQQDEFNAGMRDVEHLLRLLQRALKETRCPTSQGAAAANSERGLLEWAESLSRTTDSELQKLDVIRRQ